MLIVITNTERIGDVMKIGDISIHYLNGGKMDGGAMFGVVPKPLWSKQYNANERNQINLPTHPILIQTAQYNLIIDAGIGNGKLSEKQLRNFGVDEESHIIADLANYNLTPKDIDYVLMTHMHFDHAAGLTDQAGHAIFENAIHVVQQDEWHEFIAPNIRSKSTYWDKNKGDYSNKLILFENILNRFRVSRCNIVEVIALATRLLRLKVKEIKQFIWVIYSQLLHIKILYG